MEFNGDDFQLGNPKVRAAIEAFEEHTEEGAEEELPAAPVDDGSQAESPVCHRNRSSESETIMLTTGVAAMTLTSPRHAAAPDIEAHPAGSAAPEEVGGCEPGGELDPL